MVLLDPMPRQILQELSRDSRVSVSELARRLKCSPKTVDRKLALLEKKLGLRYVVEFNEKEVGLLSGYLMKIKFRERPAEDSLRGSLSRHPVPQFAALTRGDFDLVIYAAAARHSDFLRWANWFRQRFNRYIDDWSVGIVVGTWCGFFPLQEAIIRQLDLKEPQRTILLLLNQNARMPLKEIAKKTGLSKSTAQYHLRRVLKSKYIKGCTIIMQKPPKQVHAATFFTYRFSKDFMSRDLAARNMLLDEDPYDITNRTIIALAATGGFDDFTICSFDNIQEAYDFQKKLEGAMRDIIQSSKTALVMTVLLGSLPCRRIDIKKEYRIDWNIYELLQQ